MVDSKPYQDRGWAWMIVVGAFFTHFLTAGCEKAYSIWYIEILEQYSKNSASAAGIGGISAAVRLILGPLAVVLCKKFSVQLVVIIGGLMTFAGLIIAAFANNLSLILFGYGIIYGFGLTLVFTPALVICTTYFDKRRATALSLSLAGAGFGAFFIPQLIVKLLSIYGYRGSMLILASITLHYCISGALFFSPPAEKTEATKNEFSGRDDAQRTHSVEKCSSFRRPFNFHYLELLSDFWFTLFLTSFIFNMMGSGPVTTLIIHYAEELGVKLNISVLLLAVEGGVQVIARSLSGVIFDLKYVKNYRGVVWCAFILMSASIVCFFSLATSLTSMMVLMGIRGLSLAIYISHQTLMTCDMCRKSAEMVPHAIGLTQFSKGVGILLGSYLSGWIKDVSDDYRWAFIFLGVAQLTGALMALTAILRVKHNFCRNTASPATDSEIEARAALLSTDNHTSINCTCGRRNGVEEDGCFDTISDAFTDNHGCEYLSSTRHSSYSSVLK